MYFSRQDAYQRELLVLQRKVSQIRSLEVYHKDKQGLVSFLATGVVKEIRLLPDEQVAPSLFFFLMRLTLSPLQKQKKTRYVISQIIRSFRPQLQESIASLRACLVPIPSLPLALFPCSPPSQYAALVLDLCALLFIDVVGCRNPFLLGASCCVMPNCTLLFSATDKKCSERALDARIRRLTRRSGLCETEGNETSTKQARRRTLVLTGKLLMNKIVLACTPV